MARHLGVRYRRADAATRTPAEPTQALSLDAIAELPASLRSELRDAVLTLDVKRISQTIEKVAEHDAALSSMLARYAERFAYSPILKAIERAVREESTASG
jgi:hypothetical protein